MSGRHTIRFSWWCWTVKVDCVIEEPVRSGNRVQTLKTDQASFNQNKTKNCAWSVCKTLCKNISADLLPFHCRVILKCSLWRENLDMWCPNCKYNSLKKQGHPSTPVCTCALVGRAVRSTSQAGARAGPWNDSRVEGTNHEVLAWDGEKKCFYIPNMTTNLNAAFNNIMNFMIILSTRNNIRKEMNMKKLKFKR